VVYDKKIINFGWKRLKERFRLRNIEVDGNITELILNKKKRCKMSVWVDLN
jgi:hypothetical protein